MSHSRKRKQKTYRREQQYRSDLHEGPAQHDTTMLHIQAHEADIVKGAAQTARFLEFNDTPGSSLIQWNPSNIKPSDDGDEDTPVVWVDRYDARLLLPDVPIVESTQPTQSDTRLSPTGWSELPSDAEDTFFFSPDEVEDYHREKRRRIIEKSREDRMKAMREEHESEQIQEDVWGDSDEEPDDTQKELMHRTATHLVSSPNAAQLEMRILANHGSDKRFAFLRGRWSRAWNTIKAKARLDLNKDKVVEQRQTSTTTGLSGLTGYGGSDEESDEEPKSDTSDIAIGHDTSETKERVPVNEEAVKEARRIKAREWAQKQRALKEGRKTAGS